MRFLLLGLLCWCGQATVAQTVSIDAWARLVLKKSPDLAVSTERCGHFFTTIDDRLYRSVDQGTSWTAIDWPGDSVHTHQIVLGEDGPVFLERDILSGNSTTLHRRETVYGYHCGTGTFLPQASFDYTTGSSSYGSESVTLDRINGAFRLIKKVYSFPLPGLTEFRVQSSVDGYGWTPTYDETNAQGMLPTDAYRYPLTRIHPAHYRSAELAGTYRLGLADSTYAVPLPTAIGAALLGDTVSYIDQQQNWQYRTLTDSTWQSAPLPLPDVHLYGQWNGRYLLATPDALYRTTQPADLSTYETLASADELGSPIRAFRTTSARVLVTTADGRTYAVAESGTLYAINVELHGVQSITTRGDSLFVQSDDRWHTPAADGLLLPYSLEAAPAPKLVVTDSDSLATFRILEFPNSANGKEMYVLVRQLTGNSTVDTLRRDTLLNAPKLLRSGARLLYTTGSGNFYSDNLGTAFTPVAPDGYQPLHLDALGQWVGRRQDSLYYSTDQGTTWRSTGYPEEGAFISDSGLRLFQSGLSPVSNYPNAVTYRLKRWVPDARAFEQTDSVPFLQPAYSAYASEELLRLDDRYHLAVSARVDDAVGTYAYLLGGPFDRAVPLPIPYERTRFVSSYPVYVPYTLAVPYQVRKAGPVLYARGDAGVWRAELCDLIDSSFLQREVPLCEGGSVQVAGDTLDVAGLYTYPLAVDPGCSLTQQTTVYQVDSLSVLPDLLYCRAAPYPFFDQQLDTSGTYSHTGTLDGCPQRTELTLERAGPDTVYVAGSACPYRFFDYDGQSFPVGTSRRVRPGPDCDTLLQVEVIELERPVTYDTIALPAGSVFAGQIIYVATEVAQQLYGAAANGCDSLVYTFVDILTATDEAAFARLEVFPNPVGAQLTVRGLPVAAGRRVELALTDSYGRTHHRSRTGGTRAVIPTAQLPPGVYWLTVRSGEQAVRRRVVH